VNRPLVELGLSAAEMHRLDAGHFAVEDHLDYIATQTRRFYSKRVGALAPALGSNALLL